jgi:hypothetical protein
MCYEVQLNGGDQRFEQLPSDLIGQAVERGSLGLSKVSDELSNKASSLGVKQQARKLRAKYVEVFLVSAQVASSGELKELRVWR